MSFHLDFDKAANELNNFFADYDQCQHMAWIAAEELRANLAWVEITQQEFCRRVPGGYFTEGDREYYNNSGRFKSVQLRNGGHKFFILLGSTNNLPIKGWMKRVIFMIRKRYPMNNDYATAIYNIINKQILELRESKQVA